MMVQKHIFGGIFALCLLLSTSMTGQEFGFGIKAGLSFSTFNGETLEGESFDTKSGFHVGPSFTFRFNDLFSLRAEFLYNQLGTEYEYEGPSYFVLRTASEREDIVFGEKDMSQSIFLNYFDIPLQAAFKLGNVIELYAGVNILLLPGATGGGVIDFTNPNNTDQSFRVNLDYAYNRDDAMAGADNEVRDIRFDRTTYSVPQRLGAYYDHSEKEGRTFNTVDFGLHAGTRVFFNDALYLAVRGYYGLSDVTNNDMDIQQRRDDTDRELKFSDETDRNFSIQLSLGFSF